MVLTLDLRGVFSVAGICFDFRMSVKFPRFSPERNGFADTPWGLLDHCQM